MIYCRLNFDHTRNALKLAELLGLGRYKKVYHSTDQKRVELRRQVKHHAPLKKEIASWKCRIKTRFKEFGIFPDTGLYNLKKRKSWLEKLPHGAAQNRVKRSFLWMYLSLISF